MITCPFCGAEQVANTIFCSECGVYLLDDESRGTENLDLDMMKFETDNDSKSATGSGELDDSRIAIRLKIGDSARQIETTLTKAVHIGRLDPTSEMFPEIDLSEDNGLEKGVSRRHARITRKNGQVIVEDLGSINGTFVNGKRLAPYLGEVLNDGDQLQLGNLVIEISVGG